MPEFTPHRLFHVDVHRHFGEHTYARITARIAFDSQQFLDQLKTAITTWVKETPEGARAWQDSVENFNVGDLSTYDLGPETSLGQHLAAGGIHDLEVEIHHSHQGCQSWAYDTVLVDECELAETLALPEG